jgi:hypothetical protein
MNHTERNQAEIDNLKHDEFMSATYNNYSPTSPSCADEWREPTTPSYSNNNDNNLSLAIPTTPTSPSCADEWREPTTPSYSSSNNNNLSLAIPTTPTSPSCADEWREPATPSYSNNNNNYSPTSPSCADEWREPTTPSYSNNYGRCEPTTLSPNCSQCDVKKPYNYFHISFRRNKDTGKWDKEYVQVFPSSYVKGDGLGVDYYNVCDNCCANIPERLEKLSVGKWRKHKKTKFFSPY